MAADRSSSSTTIRRGRRGFDAERARSSAPLGDFVVAIEHIGSTAVPGLPAKPIIDL
jgi:GrpB-like predicted nucleotidyltransferase (UPF0157 family)